LRNEATIAEVNLRGELRSTSADIAWNLSVALGDFVVSKILTLFVLALLHLFIPLIVCYLKVAGC